MRIAQFLFVVLLGASVCQAGIIQYTNPDAGYTGATTLLPITVTNDTVVSSLSDGTLTMTISPSSVAHTVPGGGWSTWSSSPYSETSTPRLLADYSSTSVWLNLSTPLVIFGFEAEPDPFGLYDITADFYNGGTLVGTITRAVEGSAGARLFAAQTTDLSFTSVHVTSAYDFGMAQFRYAPAETGVPEPASWLLLAGGAAVLLWRRRAV